jgi:hypothetical protein
MPWPSTQGTPVRATTETKHFIQQIVVGENLIPMDTYCTHGLLPPPLYFASCVPELTIKT